MASKATPHLAHLLDNTVESGGVSTTPKRGRPSVTPIRRRPVDRERATRAVRNIRMLRREIRWSGTVQEILALRDACSRRTPCL